ncbi:hypothetical protein B0T24DRAFT_712504 [Lasiosphaeria ovina]|uniref:Fungal-type protein kinase domain-containing protein n=1 Tax=Lasiosphaeria ovina TaxID=92902 RepID=A0AAE0JWJ6_9PEZI|nr:hypothetical protein B0T24DRAFT_712504 [Lasiosphaeria ovina]
MWVTERQSNLQSLKLCMSLPFAFGLRQTHLIQVEGAATAVLNHPEKIASVVDNHRSVKVARVDCNNYNLVDALLNYLDCTLDCLEAISKRVFERIGTALRPSNGRRFGKSHDEKDDGQRLPTPLSSRRIVGGGPGKQRRRNFSAAIYQEWNCSTYWSDVCRRLQVNPDTSTTATPLAQPNRPIQGSIAELKLDVGFVDDPKASKDSRYHWSYILVPGELKSNPSTDIASEAWVNIGTYAREVLAAQDLL